MLSRGGNAETSPACSAKSCMRSCLSLRSKYLRDHVGALAVADRVGGRNSSPGVGERLHVCIGVQGGMDLVILC